MHWFCNGCKTDADKLLSILADLQTQIDELEDDSWKNWQDGLAQSATDMHMQWNSEQTIVERDASTGRSELQQMLNNCESKADVCGANLEVRINTL